VRAILPTKGYALCACTTTHHTSRSLLADTANVKAFVEDVTMESAAAMGEEVRTKPSVATRSAAACMKGTLGVSPQDLGVFRSLYVYGSQLIGSQVKIVGTGKPSLHLQIS
jgi:hypothetical protein